jgi:hypothetical protein
MYDLSGSGLGPTFLKVTKFEATHYLKVGTHQDNNMYLIRVDAEEVRLERVAPTNGRQLGLVTLTEPILGQKTLTLIDCMERQSPWTWAPRYEYDLEPLKSNFQKCMRQQCLEACLATARQLLAQDAAAFLRRLAVVLLEDSLLCVPAYAQVIWLMLVVGKGYCLSAADAQLVMDAVATGLMGGSRYDLEAEAVATVPKPEAELAYTLIMVRAQAGGMKFDTTFLRRLATRAATCDLVVELEISSVDLEEIPEFSLKEHMMPASIDFHCCSQLLDAVRLQTGLKASTVKDAIWWHRSSINVRAVPQTVADREEAARFKTYTTWSQIAPLVTAFTAKQLGVLEARKRRHIAQLRLDSWLAGPT